MKKNSKIYLAGHTGLVGSAILRLLTTKGYDNLILATAEELDLRRQADVELFFSKEKPEYVIIAAAKVGGIVANNTYKAEFIYDNLAIALNLIHTSHKFNVKKLLNLGSSCIYPKLAPQPLKEEYLLTGLLEPTNDAYAIAKIAAIKLCSFYNQQYGCDFFSVMPTNLYGANDNYNLETSHVMPALLRKLLLAKALKEANFEWIRNDLSKRRIGFGFDDIIDLNNNNNISDILSRIGITAHSLQIWGSGNVLREFLHVDDMADACLHLFEKFSAPQIGEFVNIGSGTDLSIKDLVQKIAAIVGYHGEIMFDSSKPDGTPRKLLDVSKLKSLGWTARIPLDEGIARIYHDYLHE